MKVDNQSEAVGAKQTNGELSNVIINKDENDASLGVSWVRWYILGVLPFTHLPKQQYGIYLVQSQSLHKSSSVGETTT